MFAYKGNHTKLVIYLCCYCETQKTLKTRNTSGMLLCCKEKTNQV